MVNIIFMSPINTTPIPNIPRKPTTIMTRYITTIAALLILTTSYAKAQVRISGRSISSGRETVTSQNEFGGTRKETIRNIGIEVSLSALKAPKETYEIEVFFVAKDNTDKTRWVYDIQKTTMLVNQGGKQFFAPPLTGETRETTRYSIELQPVGGPRIPGILTARSSSAGSKVEGWVARAKLNGSVVSVTGSLSELIDLAQRNPQAFDRAAGVTN